MDIRVIVMPSTLYAEFYIKGIPTHILNAIRRAILTEVPTLAIHDVIIYTNTSVIYDEELALRLALIPLKVDKSELNVLEEGRNLENKSLRDLIKLTARLRLHKKAENGIVDVLSGDIEPIDKKTVKPVYPNIPIARLGEGQEIDVEMIAKVGKGKDHAKWMPVSTLGYHPIARLKVNVEACDSCGDCVKACPKGILKIRDGIPVLEGIGLYLCDLCRICVRACNKKALSIKPADDEFIFRIKSVGQYKIADIIDTAITILEEKFNELFMKIEKAIKES
mgnify:CR=1 FL=1